MNRALRTFLLWLLVVTLPMQGMAASFMPVCATSHARMTQALTAEAHAEPECHHAAASTDEAAPSTSASLVSGDEVSCSACSVCCVWLSMPAGFSLPAPSWAAHAVSMAPLAPSRSHQPAGLDRPPQRLHA